MSIPGLSTVLMTADAAGPSWRQAIELSREFARSRISVALAVMGGTLSKAQRAAAAGIPSLHLFQSRFPTSEILGDWTAVDAAGRWLLNLSRRIRPDIVQLHDCVHGALPWQTPTVIAGAECARTRWESSRSAPAPYVKWTEYRQRAQAGLRASNLLMAPSREWLTAFAESYGHPKASRLVPCGVDSTLYAPEQKQPFIFSTACRSRPCDAFAVYAEAAAGVRWMAFAAGRRGIQASAPQADRVVHCGAVSEEAVRQWLLAAGIFCLPAQGEAYGIRALEAALAGCALLLSDGPAHRELWGGAAILATIDNAPDFRRALAALISDPCLRATYQRAARERGLAYGASRMAAQFLDAYQMLLASKAEQVRETRVIES